MDRVQKSKLSLYKKAMEVSARLLGLEGSGPQETWGGLLGQGLVRSSSSNTGSSLSGDQGCTGCQGPTWIGPWASSQSQTVAHRVIHAVS